MNLTSIILDMINGRIKYQNNDNRYLLLAKYIAIISFFYCFLGLILTNPYNLPPIMITVWFLSLYFFLSSFLTVFIILFRKTKTCHKYFSFLINNKFIYHEVMFISLVLVLMLGLSSLRALEMRDVVLIFATLFIVKIYFGVKN